MSALDTIRLSQYPLYMLVLSRVLQNKLYNDITLARLTILDKLILSQPATACILPSDICITIDNQADTTYKLWLTLPLAQKPSVGKISNFTTYISLAQRAARDYNITRLSPVLRLLAGYRGIYKAIKYRSKT